jgi:ABC-type polysaccharide/polyol phosphate transport system ATPase subunit
MSEMPAKPLPTGTLRFRGVSKTFPHRRGRALLRERILDLLNPSRRPRFTAIHDLSFEVKPGESLGLLGPNGAGKSTVLNLATGLLEPDAGRVEAYGRVTPLLDLGAGFHPELTGVENLRLHAAMLGLTRGEFRQRLEQIVEFSGVRDFLNEPVRTYSQGMQLRLAFSVAVHAAPDILLMDEIIAVGDQAFLDKALGKIRSLRAAGTTILFASHSPELLTMLCDRALWVEKGSILREGPVRELIEAYQGAKTTS